jgi:hypothetical protein
MKNNVFMVECDDCDWTGPEVDASGHFLTPLERHMLAEHPEDWNV